MTIIAYQIVIALSIVLVRMFSPKHLLIVCCVWTGFTIFNLFYWPLIILQMFVVWGMYGVLSSRDAAAEVELKNIDLSKNECDDSLVEGGKTGGILRVIKEINYHADVASVVQGKTLSVSAQVASEKQMIKIALASWDRKLAINNLKMTIEEKVLFEETKVRVMGALASVNPHSSDGLPLAYVVPDFNVDFNGLDAECIRAVKVKIQQVSMERDSYIDDLVLKIEDDDEFGKFLLAELNRVAGPDLPDVFNKRLRDRSLKLLKDVNSAINFRSPIKPTFAALLELNNNSKLIPAKNEGILPLGDLLTSAPLVWRARKKENPYASAEFFQGEMDDLQFPKSYLTIISFPIPNPGRQMEVRNIAWSRKIPYLLHFTRAVNLSNILIHGICPVEAAAEFGISPVVNDNLRLDGCLNASSFSIAFPNSKMFYKYRAMNPSEDWVVLVVHPQVLWDKNTAFCSFNAADNRVRHRALAELSSSTALEEMFGERDKGNSRLSQRLRSFDPTDVQAEVLVFDCVEPKLIAEIIFDSEHAHEKYKTCIKDKIVRIHRRNEGMFSSRQRYISTLAAM